MNLTTTIEKKHFAARLAKFEGATINSISIDGESHVRLETSVGVLALSRGEYSGIRISVTDPVTEYSLTYDVAGKDVTETFTSKEEAEARRTALADKGLISYDYELTETVIG